MAKLLLVTDDAVISDMLARVLRIEGHVVHVEADGAAGLKQAKGASYELIILDLELVDLDRVDLCQRIREGGVGAPVMILTARAHETDIVVALDAGADDYMTKPFRLAELHARVRSLLRRGDELPTAEDLTRCPLRMDTPARLVFLNNQEVYLTTKEFDLLRVLVQGNGKVIARKKLIEEVWGGDYATTKTLDVHISNLRHHLRDDVKKPTHIITVRGVGFRFQNEPRALAS